MDRSYFSSIAGSLKSVERPGFYATGGQCSMPLPSLCINSAPDVILGLPLGESHVKSIIESATQAPFGRGEETIVDTSVRKTWQLSPSQFTIKNGKWAQQLQALLEKVTVDLGCDVRKRVTCELYKLLLYEPGGHFKCHRDTEKSPGMFGTLVIQLPSNYSGGQLSVHHLSKSTEFDFSGPAAFDNFHYAAFYADCQHEIKPVTKGHRLCLVYNLVYRGSGDHPAIANNQKTVSAITSSMSEWSADKSEHPPTMMIYLLEHKYCEASLSFQQLKNKDRAVADALLEAKKEADFDLYLGQINLTENWTAYHDWGFGRKRTPGFTAGELMDEEASADILKSPDGRTIGKIELDTNYFVPKGFFNGLDPDKENFAEATGNEGASCDKQYHWTALLFWPVGKRMANLGVANMITLLGMDLTAPPPVDQDKMVEAARDILRICGSRGGVSSSDGIFLFSYSSMRFASDISHVLLLQCLHKIGMADLITEGLKVILACSHSIITSAPFSKEIVAIGRKHGWNVLRAPLQAAFDKLSATTLDDYCKFLNGLSGTAKPSKPQKDLCQGFADRVIGVLSAESDEDPTNRTRPLYLREKPRSKKFLMLLFKSLLTLDHTEGLQALVQAVSAKPTRYPVMEALVPICEKLHKPGTAPLQALLTHCISTLEASTSADMSSPSDWILPAPISCACEDCLAVKKFLQHPTETQLRLKTGKARRVHVSKMLDGAKCSVTVVTERVGNPHTLVITKTRDGYWKAVKTNQEEKVVLSRLRALTGGAAATPSAGKASKGSKQRQQQQEQQKIDSFSVPAGKRQKTEE